MPFAPKLSSPPTSEELKAYYEWLNRHDKAIADFTEAVRLDPKNAGAYYGRGRAYDTLGQKAKSEADLTKARQLCYKGE